MRASLHLAHLYVNAHIYPGVQNDLHKALEAVTFGAEAGDVSSMLEVGMLVGGGSFETKLTLMKCEKEIKTDYKRAWRMFSEVASADERLHAADVAVACERLGDMCFPWERHGSVAETERSVN